MSFTILKWSAILVESQMLPASTDTNAKTWVWVCVTCLTFSSLFMSIPLSLSLFSHFFCLSLFSPSLSYYLCPLSLLSLSFALFMPLSLTRTLCVSSPLSLSLSFLMFYLGYRGCWKVVSHVLAFMASLNWQFAH